MRDFSVLWTGDDPEVGFAKLREHRSKTRADFDLADVRVLARMGQGVRTRYRYALIRYKEREERDEVEA